MSSLSHLFKPANLSPTMSILIRQWLRALRSGGYRQGREGLCSISDNPDSEGYCCLGVLCDLVDPSTWVKSDGPYKEWHDSITSQVFIGLPPDPFFFPTPNTDPAHYECIPWAEISQAVRYKTGHSLQTHNDGSCNCPPKSFTEIADFIESVCSFSEKA